MRLNNVIVKSDTNITFGGNSNITLSCLAINSRPAINIKIYDPTKNLSLPLTSSKTGSNPNQFCDGNGYCQTSVVVNFNTGYASINKLKQIACSAVNSNTPYDMNVQITFPFSFTGMKFFSSRIICIIFIVFI